MLGMTLRLIHAFGLSSEAEPFALRVTGMALTFTCYLVATAFLLCQSSLETLVESLFFKSSRRHILTISYPMHRAMP